MLVHIYPQTPAAIHEQRTHWEILNPSGKRTSTAMTAALRVIAKTCHRCIFCWQHVQYVRCLTVVYTCPGALRCSITFLSTISQNVRIFLLGVNAHLTYSTEL